MKCLSFFLFLPLSSFRPFLLFSPIEINLIATNITDPLSKLHAWHFSDRNQVEIPVLDCFALLSNGRQTVEKSKRLQLIFLHYLCDFCLLDFGCAQVHGQSVTDLKTWRSRQCCVRSLVAFCVPVGVLAVAEAKSAGGSSGQGFKGEGGQRMSNIGRGHWAGQRELDILDFSRTFPMEQKCSLLFSALCCLWCVQVRYPRPAGQTSNLNNFMGLVKKIKMAAATVTEHLPFFFHLMWDGKKMLQVGLSQLQTEQGRHHRNV